MSPSSASWSQRVSVHGHKLPGFAAQVRRQRRPQAAVSVIGKNVPRCKASASSPAGPVSNIPVTGELSHARCAAHIPTLGFAGDTSEADKLQASSRSACGTCRLSKGVKLGSGPPDRELSTKRSSRWLAGRRLAAASEHIADERRADQGAVRSAAAAMDYLKP